MHPLHYRPGTGDLVLGILGQENTDYIFSFMLNHLALTTFGIAAWDMTVTWLKISQNHFYVCHMYAIF